MKFGLLKAGTPWRCAWRVSGKFSFRRTVPGTRQCASRKQ